MQTLDTAPDWERFYPGRIVGAHVWVYEVVDSTMNVARSLASRGAPHGTAVRAEVQRMGRGRFSRRWESGRGDSLLTSVVLQIPPFNSQLPLSVAGSLAVRDTIQEISEASCGIKWPNDVHVEGRKIAGVLVESQVTTDGAGFAILGIGINVNLDSPSVMEIADTATSLSGICGVHIDVNHVEEILFRNLDTTLRKLSEANGTVINQWRTHLTTLGQSVTVRTRTGVIAGVALGTDEQGALLVQSANGKTHRMLEGDVTLRS